MTNEEALDELNVIYERLSHPEDCEQGVYSFRDGDYLEALDMALELLEKEPCDDCISREYLINKIGSVDGLEGVENSNLFAKHYMDIVKGAPLVQPTRPTGKWEYVQYDYNPNIGNWHCSECRNIVIECANKNEEGGIPKYKYCPNCGARMAESEDKE